GGGGVGGGGEGGGRVGGGACGPVMKRGGGEGRAATAPPLGNAGTCSLMPRNARSQSFQPRPPSLSASLRIDCSPTLAGAGMANFTPLRSVKLLNLPLSTNARRTTIDWKLRSGAVRALSATNLTGMPRSLAL